MKVGTINGLVAASALIGIGLHGAIRANKSLTDVAEVETAVAYSCGYNDGQVDTGNQLPSVMPHLPRRVSTYCDKIRDAALRNGFIYAKEQP